MKADSNGRRLRREPTSTGKSVRAKHRDLVWFQAMANHGPLPAPYLHEFTKEIHSHYQSSQDRLTDLFHEKKTGHGGRYLRRLEAENYSHAIYDLRDPAYKALEGKHPHSTRAQGAPFEHTMFTSCTTAALEIGTIGTDIEYIHGQDILRGQTMGTSIEIDTPKGKQTIGYNPDQLCMLKSGDRSILLIIECDRGKEPITSDNYARKSYERNFRQIQKFVETGHYKKHYGVNCGVFVLNVMAVESRMNAYLNLIGKLKPEGCNYMLFQYVPGFDTKFLKFGLPPTYLFTEAWKRSGKPDIKINMA